MYQYSKSSLKKLESTHPDLQHLFKQVIKVIDCTIIYGLRTLEQQKDLYAQGRTRPGRIVTNLDGIIKRSKHQDGLAVDVVPYPIDWENRERFVYFAGVVKGIAGTMNIKIRWGGDWDGDNELSDQTWMDLPHFELI
ncbi:MAG: M15 family metallopeptidase [Ignavibacteriaceae bacterium]